jgi:hypothetical protein
MALTNNIYLQSFVSQSLIKPKIVNIAIIEKGFCFNVYTN